MGSTEVWPPLSVEDRIRAEEANLARELQWLLTSLQDTFASLKDGLDACEALLAPVEPGSTLVVSTSRSESVKGFVTRVGTRLVKGDIQLRLQTLPPPRNSTSFPLRLSTSPTAPSLQLKQLSTVRNLINQSLDVVDTSRWTGDSHNANFISGQLRLLLDLIQETRSTLKGGEHISGPWTESNIDENTFDPPLPPALSFHIAIIDASLSLQLRTLQQIHTSSSPSAFDLGETLSGFSLRHRLGLAQQLPRHSESDQVFPYKGHEVKVREKIIVQSLDPSLLALEAKLSALEHSVAVARSSLSIVMGISDDD